MNISVSDLLFALVILSIVVPLEYINERLFGIIAINHPICLLIKLLLRCFISQVLHNLDFVVIQSLAVVNCQAVYEGFSLNYLIIITGGSFL